MTVYILEGVDQVGKTTLARQFEEAGFFKPDMSWLRLLEEGGHWYDDESSRRAEWERLLVASRFIAEVGKYRDIVLDRFYASQYVYGGRSVKGWGMYADEISANLCMPTTITLLLEPGEFKSDGVHSAEQMRKQNSQFKTFLGQQKAIHGDHLNWMSMPAFTTLRETTGINDLSSDNRAVAFDKPVAIG